MKKMLSQICRLINQLDGIRGSISDPLNEQALPVVVQPHRDANSTDDPLQVQSLQLVEYGVYTLTGHDECLIEISSCDWFSHGKNKLHLTFEIPDLHFWK